MRFLAAILLTAATTFAARSQSTWTACDTGGRSVTLRQDAGDLVTLPFPGPNRVPLRVALLTAPFAGSFAGRTVTATFWIDASNPVYVGANAGGCIVPANLRLYFTTTTGVYKVGQADKNPSRYWWARYASMFIEEADGGQLVTLTATLDPSQWSNANGQIGESIPAAFNSAASIVRQAGLSFGGGCYFDTGIGMASGSATLHLIGYAIQ